MTEGQCSNHQPGHDFVANPETNNGIEQVVRKRNRGRHGDRIATEQGKIHAVFTLGHAITHRRNAAGYLSCGLILMRNGPYLIGVSGVRLMGTEHIVIGCHDTEVNRGFTLHERFRLRGAGCHAVRQITAAHVSPAFAPIRRSGNFLKITATRLLTATRDRFGDSFDDNVHHYWFSTASPPASDEELFSRGPENLDRHRFQQMIDGVSLRVLQQHSLGFAKNQQTQCSGLCDRTERHTSS